MPIASNLPQDGPAKCAKEPLSFCRFMNDNPTIYHFVDATVSLLENSGFEILHEGDRSPQQLRKGHKYVLTRNSTSLIAFQIGADFTPGRDGIAFLGTHIDANRISLKPSSKVGNIAHGLLLGVSPYGGGLGPSWWDRDLGLGGQVLCRTSSGSKAHICKRLVRLPGTVGSIPSLAPHFGAKSLEHNKETRMVPLIGLDDTDSGVEHPAALISALAKELDCSSADILGFDLEMFSAEAARVGGISDDFIYSSRMDDRLCAYAGIQALIKSEIDPNAVQLLACFDNEEIGSNTRQGAGSNFINVVIDRIMDDCGGKSANKSLATLARSMFISADVTHAFNPSYADAYLDGNYPLLNKGMCLKRLGRFASDSRGNVLADEISAAAGQNLQIFAPRNDVASGGTIGPIIAGLTGIRTIDVGIPILSMHSIREITGSHDVQLGIDWFQTYFERASALDTGIGAYASESL